MHLHLCDNFRLYVAQQELFHTRSSREQSGGPIFPKGFFSKPRNYNTFVLFEVFFTRLSTSGNIDVLVIAFYKVYVAKLEDVP